MLHFSIFNLKRKKAVSSFRSVMAEPFSFWLFIFAVSYPFFSFCSVMVGPFSFWLFLFSVFVLLWQNHYPVGFSFLQFPFSSFCSVMAEPFSFWPINGRWRLADRLGLFCQQYFSRLFTCSAGKPEKTWKKIKKKWKKMKKKKMNKDERRPMAVFVLLPRNFPFKWWIYKLDLFLVLTSNDDISIWIWKMYIFGIVHESITWVKRRSLAVFRCRSISS